MDSPLLFVLVLVTSGAVHGGDISTTNISYLGCYDVSFALGQSYHYHIPNVNFVKCSYKCSQLKTRYAGVGGSNNFCYCGGDIADESVKRGDSECNLPCPDDEAKTCGGEWLMSLYELTGVDSNEFRADNVSFLIGLSAGVRLYNTSDLSTYIFLLTTTDWAYSVDYHYEKNMLFAYAKNKIYRSTLRKSGAASEPLTVKLLSSCDAMTVDWVHDKVFWVKCDLNANTLMSMDLNGGGTAVVMRRPGEKAIIRRMVIDPYAGMLFWTADGVVETYDISEDSFRTNISQADMSVRAMAVDLAERRLYYVGTFNRSTSLFSVDYEGEDLSEHFSVQQLRSVYGMGLHAGQVYWVNYANADDVIYSTPLYVKQGSRYINTLKTIDKAVWHMKLVHPDLQKPPRRDPCEVKNCSHYCLKVNYATARCLCPDGLKIHTNGTTCITLGTTGQHFSRFTVGLPTTLHATSTPLATNQTFHHIYMGCYTYVNKALLTPHVLYTFKVEDCLKLCGGLDNRYAYIDNSSLNCFCSQQAPDTEGENDLLCHSCANEERMCGGNGSMALYKVISITLEGSEMKDMGILIGRKNGVDFLNGTEGSYNILTEDLDTMYAVDYHYSERMFFALWDSSIYVIRLADHENPKEEDEAVHVEGCFTFTVDWVHDHLIWPNCGKHPSIMISSLYGSYQHTLVSLSTVNQSWVTDIVVDPYVGLLFWLAGDSLTKCNLDGTGLTVVTSNLPTVSSTGLTLDMNLRRVYFTGFEVGVSNIYYVLYNGSKVFRLNEYPLASRDLWSLAVLNSTVYYVSHMIGKSSSLQRAIDQATVLRTNQVIYNLKLVHPQLQSPVHIDLCTHFGCSHYCVLVEGIATCRCPKYFILEDDMKTCEEAEDEVPPFVMILKGLGLLIFILLAAGVLMCVCDKLWSKVQPTVVRVAQADIFRGPVSYARRQRDNLI